VITTEAIHRVQALVDGELSAKDRSAVEALLKSDSDLQTLHEALQSEKRWLKGNEKERFVPEPRDFYWSKIENAIEREDAKAAASSNQSRPLGFWLRWLLPVGGVAAVLFWAMIAQFGGPTNPAPSMQKASSYSEVDSPLDSGSLITFRSETEGVTVFWISSD
jgi:anti-sigma factor RsiW